MTTATKDRGVMMKDAAVTMGVSIPMVQKLINNGELRYMRIGRAVRILESSLNAYIERNTYGAAD